MRGEIGLDLGADRPDEADELAGEGGDDLAGGLALVGEAPVPPVQALLGAPRNGGDLRGQRLLKPALAQAQVRSVTVVPSRFYENAAKVRVATLGDRAAAASGYPSQYGRPADR
jgi:hypothetical protein